MGKIIRTLRLKKEHRRRTNIYKKGYVSIPRVHDTQAVVSKIVHESGRHAPLAIIEMMAGKKKKRGLIVATEGIYEGQKIQIGSEEADPEKTGDIGSIVKISSLAEGSLVSMVEKKPFDGGKFARSCGCSATILQHNKQKNQTTIKLPSNIKVRVSGKSRAIIGVIAGGGKDDKPLLKAVNAYHKYKTKGIPWPRVRGVAMNPVEHPHGGGNHQHIGHPSTVSRHAPINGRVGLVAARSTGRKKGSRKITVN